MKKMKYAKNDILLVHESRLAIVNDPDVAGAKGTMFIEYVDDSGQAMVDQNMKGIVNLGCSKESLASFYAAKSVHERLDHLGLK